MKKGILLKQRILYLQPVSLFLPFSRPTYTASLGIMQLFGDEILFPYTLRQGNLQESERQKNKAEEQKKQYKDRASRAAQRVENLGESVSQMYGNAGCDSAVLQDLTGSSEVSSGNLMQCLGLLEQRVEELSSTLILTHNQVSCQKFFILLICTQITIFCYTLIHLTPGADVLVVRLRKASLKISSG